MHSTIANVVHIGILVIAGFIAVKCGIDLNGYTVGMIVGSFAAGFAAGIKGKGTP